MIPLSELLTRYSTWVVAVLMGAVAWWLDLSDVEQAKYIAQYPIVAKLAPWAGLVSFLVARGIVQTPGKATEQDAQKGRASLMALAAMAVLSALLLSACATGAVSKNAAAQKAYQTIDAYVLLIENGIDRGRIDKATALAAVDKAKKARASVAQAEALLAGCTAEPCDGTAILNSVQPLLLEYERTLREQGASK